MERFVRFKWTFLIQDIQTILLQTVLTPAPPPPTNIAWGSVIPFHIGSYWCLLKFLFLTTRYNNNSIVLLLHSKAVRSVSAWSCKWGRLRFNIFWLTRIQKIDYTWVLHHLSLRISNPCEMQPDSPSFSHLALNLF